MRVIYNGIDMCVIETQAFDCEAVYDDSGVDYLYTKVTMVVRAIINGQDEAVVKGKSPANGPVMSYAFKSGPTDTDLTRGSTLDGELTAGRPENPGATGVPARGQPNVGPSKLRKAPAPTPFLGLSGIDTAVGIDRQKPSDLREIEMKAVHPAMTHATIRHRLSTPRGKLFIFAGQGLEALQGGGQGRAINIGLGAKFKVANAILFLQSPRENMACDCKNGPFPRILSVHGAVGDAATLFVDWAVETYINEGPENFVTPFGALVSHRFSQTHSIDDSGYTTVATTGTAIFRTDFVYSNPYINPDGQRRYVFMPIMQGFVRENIQVTGRTDVTGVDYSYSDRQVPVNFPAGPFARAAKISAVHRQAVVNNMHLLEGAMYVYGQVLGLKANRNFANMEKEGTDKDTLKLLRKLLRPRSRRGRPLPPPAAPGGASP